MSYGAFMAGNFDLSKRVQELQTLLSNGKITDREFELLVSSAVTDSHDDEVVPDAMAGRDCPVIEHDVSGSEDKNRQRFNIVRVGNPIETVVTSVGLLLSFAAIAFAAFLPFDLNNLNGTSFDASCRPPMFEFYRSSVSNPLYGTYDAEQAERARQTGRADSINNMLARGARPTQRNVCQESATDRVVLAVVVIAMSLAAIAVTRRLREKQLL